MEPVIDMRGVNKSYGQGDVRVQVLRDIHFRVEPGEFVAILGPSGSGKSTLMNIIGLIDTADDGLYRLSGELIAHKDDNALAALRNEHIGFVFQRFNLIHKFSAEQNAALPLLFRGLPHREAVAYAREMLTSLGLGDRLTYRPYQLSGGQQQRVAIARALCANPNVILADEPTGALDTRTGKEVLRFFTELNRLGKTIILITHDLGIAQAAKRVVRIEDGRLMEDFLTDGP